MRISAAKSLVAVLALALPLGLALAESPPDKKDTPNKKPGGGALNLSTAQKLAAQAYDKLDAAEQAGEYDSAGHAAKAKALLKQVNEELKLAWEKVPDKKKNTR
jgi:hypothetical protein